MMRVQMAALLLLTSQVLVLDTQVWNDFISNNSGIDIVNVAYPGT